MGSTSERLPSFKGPRDLSLSSRGGGRGKPNTTAGSSAQARPKRVFTPNIPPKRDRSAAGSAAESLASSSGQKEPKDGSRSSRGRPPRGARGGGRGGTRGGKQRPELVQSESIFADGVGDPVEARRNAASQYRSGYGGSRYKAATEGGSSRISSMNRTTLNTLIKKEDEESSNKIFGSEKFEPDEEEDTSPDNANVPVVLPLSHYVPEFYMEPSTFELSPDSLAKVDSPVAGPSVPGLSTTIKIKEEKVDDDDLPSIKIKQEKIDAEEKINANLLGMMPLDSTTFASTYRSRSQNENGTLVYFQFPDELPVLEGSVKESVDQQTPGKLVQDINDLSEGFIGRLQILSSGRTRFIIGENSFDVDPGRPVGFRQELYSVDTDNNTLTNLGSVNKKFVLTPDIEYLLRDAL